MLANGFMSTIDKLEQLQLGRTEKLFLAILSFGPSSTYKISKGLRNGIMPTPNGIFTTGINSMAYKNVHKRIKRLSSLRLIEEVEGNFKRNTKMYKMTTLGLIEYLLDLNILIPDVISLYRHDPLIETLVYQYFELETIARFEVFPLSQLRKYLRKCCEAILSTVDAHKYQTRFIKSSGIPNSETIVKEHEDLLPFYIDETIQNEAKKFVFEIVNMYKYEDPYKSDNNNQDLFPREALLKDNKFLHMLREIKKDFDEGCRNFL